MELLERYDADEKLDAAFASTGHATGRIALVSGEAGIGKSTLIEHFAKRLPAGTRLAWGMCEPLSASAPLAPFREIACQLGGRLSELIAAEAAPETFRTEMLDSLGRLGPTVIVVEDAHWADHATINLLTFLGRRIQRTRTLIVVTYRDDEIDSHHTLRSLLGALATSRAVVRIALEPLSLEAVAQLAGRSIADAVVLHRRTGGNPFLVSEVLASDVPDAIPHAVSDLVLERMSRLPEADREFLQVVSVLGHASLAEISPVFPGATAAAELAMGVGLLRSEGEVVAFRHDLIRQAVIDSISAPVRADRYRLALDILVTAGVEEPARLAHLAYGAGDPQAIRTYGLPAARQAAAFGANREAARHFEAVLAVGDWPEPAEYAELLESYAGECTILDRHRASTEAYGKAIALWTKLGDLLRTGAAHSKMVIPLIHSGRNAEAEAAARQAIAVLEPLGPSAAFAAALRMEAQLRMLDRQIDQAVHFGLRSIDMAERIGDFDTLAVANQAVGTALLAADDEQGKIYLDRAMAISQEHGFECTLVLCHLNAGTALGEQFHLEEAESYLQRGLATAPDQELQHYRGYMTAWQAMIRLYWGRFDETIGMARQLLGIDDRSALTRIVASCALGRALTRLGDPEGDAVLARALELALPTGTLQRLAPVRLARAEAAWLRGDRQATLAEAGAVMDLALNHRHKWYAGESAYWHWRCGGGDFFPEWVAEPYRLARAGRWQEAADAWAALGCRFEQARALAEGDHAAKMRALSILDGMKARPAASLLRQQLRREGLKNVPRGPRETTQRNAYGLTGRQMEIATLAAEGCGNAAIARRLRISAKTVEHHVTAILAKLGISRRDEIAALFTPTDSAPAI